jgi:hypothetical protein
MKAPENCHGRRHPCHHSGLLGTKRKRRANFTPGANSLPSTPRKLKLLRAAFGNGAHRIGASVDGNRAPATTSHIKGLVCDRRVAFDRPGQVRPLPSREHSIRLRRPEHQGESLIFKSMLPERKGRRARGSSKGDRWESPERNHQLFQQETI